MILILFLTLLIQQPEPVVFDTVVTESTTQQVTIAWECADKPGVECDRTIPRSEWATGSYRHWPKEVERGQLLKAVFFVGKLKSIPDCNTRLREARREYAQGLDMQTPTNSLMPEDCVRVASRFIRDLLEKTAPKELKRSGG
jgi:hypothetical protein